MQGHSTTLPLLTAAIRTAHSAMLQELQKIHKSFRNLEAPNQCHDRNASYRRSIHFRLYGVCLMALKRLSGHCEHFWEARYDATPIAPEDHLSVDGEDKIYAFTTCRLS
jgi:hypothetical protein